MEEFEDNCPNCDEPYNTAEGCLNCALIEQEQDEEWTTYLVVIK